MMSSGKIAQHRNYGALIARHEREMKVKRIIRIFVYVLIIAFMTILFIIAKRWSAKDVSSPKSNGQAMQWTPSPSQPLS